MGLPVRNGGQFLSQAMDAILTQDFDSFRLVISDNASVDQTPNICREYERRDPRVSYVHLLNPVSAWENFTSLLENCSTEYFMWAAHDDLWDRNWLCTLIERLDAGTDIGAFGILNQIDCFGAGIPSHPAHRSRQTLGSDAKNWVRQMRFILAGEKLGKANLIYAVFRTEPLRLEVTRAMNEGIDFDCAVIFRLLDQGSIAVVESTNFYKRICPGNTAQRFAGFLEPPQRRPFTGELAQRLHAAVLTLRENIQILRQYRSGRPSIFGIFVPCLRAFKYASLVGLLLPFRRD